MFSVPMFYTLPGDRFIRMDSSTSPGYVMDVNGFIRADATSGAKKCTPGKTVPCGNVCRTPINCKKGKASESTGRLGSGANTSQRVGAIGKENLSSYAQAFREKRAAEIAKKRGTTVPKRPAPVAPNETAPAKKTRKPRTAKPVETASAPTDKKSKRTAKSARSSKPEQTSSSGDRDQLEFSANAMDVLQSLNKKHNHKGMVPIWQLREEMQKKGMIDKSTDGNAQFNDLLKKMQSDGDLYLQSGEAIGATDDQKRNSVNSDVRGLLFYATPPNSQDDRGNFKPKDRPNGTSTTQRSPKSGQSPKESKPRDYGSFESGAIKKLKSIDNAENHSGLVPIWRLREEMGVGEGEFNDWLKRMQSSGKVYLQEGSDDSFNRLTDKQKKGIISSPIRGNLLYVSPHPDTGKDRF